ncbi:MAG: hypothetical protein ACD_3C00054G0019 [uncultured bacterium (gcode 4)]|uniref:STAS domain-containing protein n=1 Tax=uncultured bacterium (gcode 4) TaxID=1234023 RepID=K2GDY9_9BACT|nr:MAG: hypothetical protein ACD_3C00054G0019 [uncultured bacterium (gcode 4)]
MVAYVYNYIKRRFMMFQQWKPFNFEISFEEWLIVFKLTGDADSVTTDSIFEKIMAETSLFNKIVLDMADLAYCNSRFLWQLFSLADSLEKKMGKVCIRKCNQAIIETLTIVWMFDVIPMCETVAEARQYLTNHKEG